MSSLPFHTAVLTIALNKCHSKIKFEIRIGEDPSESYECFSGGFYSAFYF